LLAKEILGDDTFENLRMTTLASTTEQSSLHGVRRTAQKGT